MATMTRSPAPSMLTSRPVLRVRSATQLQPPRIGGPRIKSPIFDTTPPKSIPVATVPIPAPGTQLLPGIPISFNLSDSHGFKSISVYTISSDGMDLIYDGGFYNSAWNGSFASNYTGSLDGVSNINKNFAFSILKLGGWILAPTLYIKAINIDGIEA